jgi:endogenous inhibitor of DNA gyrase (YacG/DUF329 family)
VCVHLDDANVPVICPTCQTLIKMQQNQFGRLKPISANIVAQNENPLPISQRGLHDFCDDMKMRLICPTCQAQDSDAVATA